MRLLLQPVGARGALAEGLERGEALDRIEELGGEGGIGLLAAARIGDVVAVPQRRCEQRDEGEAEQHDRHRPVDEGDGAEDQDRRQQRDQELRQEHAEIGFELLDPVDQRQRQRAGTLARHRARPQRGDPVIQRAAKLLLDVGAV